MRRNHTILVGGLLLVLAAIVAMNSTSLSSVSSSPQTNEKPSSVQTRLSVRSVEIRRSFTHQTTSANMADSSASRNYRQETQSYSSTGFAKDESGANSSSSSIWNQPSNSVPQSSRFGATTTAASLQRRYASPATVTTHSSSEVVDTTKNLVPALQPAAFIVTDDINVSTPEAQERLHAIVADFTNALEMSGNFPTDPAYRGLWDREQAIADARFRSMYGGHVWMNHHIKGHHAQSETLPP
jgi:hypothetical protein